jgi:hypothetical protein
MTIDTQNRLTALILYSVRVLQERVSNDPELHSFNLETWYGIKIDPAAIEHELEDIAECINSSDRELFPV